MQRSGQDFATVMELLRSKGLRMTPQRRAIVSEVMRTPGHISPTEVARRVQGEMPGVNASTVYRTLTLLEEVGVLQHSHLESGAEYHRADEAQHVHLTCGNCGRDDELFLREARDLQELIRHHHGFVADLTHFAITGLCKQCATATTDATAGEGHRPQSASATGSASSRASGPSAATRSS